MSEWINVAERLPTNSFHDGLATGIRERLEADGIRINQSEKVMVRTTDGAVHRAFYNFEEGIWWSFDTNRALEVVAWREVETILSERAALAARLCAAAAAAESERGKG